jgi:hypothetical protein
MTSSTCDLRTCHFPAPFASLWSQPTHSRFRPPSAFFARTQTTGPMDSDRKSTVSSFYGSGGGGGAGGSSGGGRRSSTDRLNNDFHTSPVNFDGRPSTTSAGAGGLRDDASSFYNPTRGSRNLDGRPSAGYNRGSFFMPGREEPLKGGYDEEEALGGGGGGGGGEPAWDIYADFNNAGPKYSSQNSRNGGYVPCL